MPRTTATNRSLIRNVPFSVNLPTSTGVIQSGSSVAISGSGAWTVGGWVYMTSNQALSVWDIMFGGVHATSFWVGGNNGNFGLGMGIVWSISTIKMRPYMNKWIHLAGSYSGGANGTYKLYINGILQYSNTPVHTPSITAAAFAINNYANSASHKTYGYYNEAFCATSELTQTQIYNLAYGISIPTLALYWKMNDGSGTMVADSSGNSNNGTITGGTWSLNSYSKERLTIRSFPYVLQFVRASSSRSSIPYSNFGTTLSFSAWIKPRLNGNAGDIVGVMDTLVRISPTDIKLYTDGTLGSLASVSFNFEHNRLYHLGVSVTGITVKFYINGSLLATTTASAGVDTTNSSNYIGYYSVAPQVFEGELGEVAIWSRVLSDTEFADIYFRNIVSTTNLERYYKLATGSGTTATDSSPNAQNGTITACTWQPGFFASRSQASNRTQIT